jgi:flagellar protein FlbD
MEADAEAWSSPSKTRGARLAERRFAMLKLTRLNNQTVVVNPDHIYAAEAAPDTTLKLAGGERIIVRETLDELISCVVEYRRRVRDPFGIDQGRDAAAVVEMTDRHLGDASAAMKGGL